MTDQFLPGDLTIELRPEGVVLKHAHSDQALCMAVRTQNPAVTGAVGEQYFLASGCATAAGDRGKSPPAGLLSADTPLDTKRNRWGLTRADDIQVAAGGRVVVWLCVGVGKDGDSAVTSARTLLNSVDDTPAGAKKPRVGAYTLAREEHAKARYSSGNDAIDRLMSQTLINTPCIVSRRIGVPSRSALDFSGYTPAMGGFTALGWEGYRPDWSAAQLNVWFSTLSKPDGPILARHALPSSDLFAALELAHEAGTAAVMKEIWPFAEHRYKELLAGCRVSEGSWLFAWPQIGQDGKATLPADALADPECTAWVAATAHLLGITQLLAGGAANKYEFMNDWKQTVEALNRDLWTGGSTYAPRTVSGIKSGAKVHDSGSLTSLMPLMAGPNALTAERRAALLKQLTDPDGFWSPAGLRSLSKRAARYNAGDRTNGGVEYGANWLIWRGLIELGEIETANRLAANLVNGYIKAAQDSGAQPQYLNGDTGAACGAMDWAGDAGCILWLFRAYHTAGTVTGDSAVDIQDHHYDVAGDSLRVIYQSLTGEAGSVLQCVMGAPGRAYTITGDVKSTVTADATGVVVVRVPGSGAIQQIDIQRVAAAQ
jgi:hypothetical protein